MNIISLVILAFIGLFTVIGLITGLIKGFTNVRSWAVELLLTGVIGIAISKLISSKTESNVAAGIIALAVTVVLICVFMLIFAVIRKTLKKKIDARKQLSYYKQYDEREDHTEQILNAIGTEDKKKYKKLTKRKFKQSGGAWSVVDRVFGGITLAIKGAVITGFIAAITLTVLDFTRLAWEGGKLYSAFGSLYEGGAWSFFRNYIFDFIVVGLITVCIKSGYSSGISSSLWSLIVLGLVVGAGFLAFSLAFNAQDLVAVAGNLQTKLPSVLSNETIAKVIVGLGLFLLMLVGVILIAVFVPKLIDRARDSAVFCGVDGVLGAIVLTALIIAILLAVGAVVNSLYDLEFMNVFNAYFEKSGIATFIYNRNILNAMGVLNNLPIKGWLE